MSYFGILSFQGLHIHMSLWAQKILICESNFLFYWNIIILTKTEEQTVKICCLSVMICHSLLAWHDPSWRSRLLSVSVWVVQAVRYSDCTAAIFQIPRCAQPSLRILNRGLFLLTCKNFLFQKRFFFQLHLLKSICLNWL